jgi:hypothetical protein
MRVLEPSAGKGNIADVIQERFPEAVLEVAEWNYNLREILKLKGYTVIGSDCFELKEPVYDVIVANPPVEDLADIEHVRHYFSLLKPGGVLVSVISESPFFRKEKRAEEFREWLNENGYDVDVEPGAFKDAERSTGVKVRYVVLEKSNEGQPRQLSAPSPQAEPVLQCDKCGTTEKMINIGAKIGEHRCWKCFNEELRELEERRSAATAKVDAFYLELGYIKPEALTHTKHEHKGWHVGQLVRIDWQNGQTWTTAKILRFQPDNPDWVLVEELEPRLSPWKRYSTSINHFHTLTDTAIVPSGERITLVEAVIRRKSDTAVIVASQLVPQPPVIEYPRPAPSRKIVLPGKEGQLSLFDLPRQEADQYAINLNDAAFMSAADPELGEVVNPLIRGKQPIRCERSKDGLGIIIDDPKAPEIMKTLHQKYSRKDLRLYRAKGIGWQSI